MNYNTFAAQHELALEKVIEHTLSGRLEFFYTSPVYTDPELLTHQLKLLFPFASGIEVTIRESAAPNAQSSAVPVQENKTKESKAQRDKPTELAPFDLEEEPDGQSNTVPIQYASKPEDEVRPQLPAQTPVPKVDKEAACEVKSIPVPAAKDLADWQQARLAAKMKEIEKNGAAYEKASPASNAPVGKIRTGGMLIGKPIRQEPVQLGSLSLTDEQQLKNICVQGEILSVEKKDISDKSVLYKFSFTDNTSSISGKRFIPKKKEEQIALFDENLQPGRVFRFYGNISYDEFDKEKLFEPMAIMAEEKETRTDDAPVKRVELHMHTQYSAMDAVSKTSKIIERVKSFGHDAVGITDHGVLQAYPEIQNKTRGTDIKVLYGVEGYLVDTGTRIMNGPADEPFNGNFIFFDLETTGTSVYTDKVIEIAAVRITDGRIIDTFQTFVNPHRPLKAKITELTGITDAMLEGAPDEDTAYNMFLDYAGDTVLAAHNAVFDTGFLRTWMKKQHRVFDKSYLDTLPLARAVVPDIARYNMNRLCSYFKIKNERAHRALDDAIASAKVMMKLFALAEKKDVTGTAGLNSLLDVRMMALKQPRPWHVIVYAKNQDGIRDLYELVSDAHLKYFYKKPRIPKSLLAKKRENFLIGSACEAGELYQAVAEGAPDDELRKIASFYDFLEVQPLGNNMFKTKLADSPCTVEDLRENNRIIINLGKELGKPVVATGDVHFVDPEDKIFREILQDGQKYDNAWDQPPLYYRNTQEMLDEFDYIPEDVAREIVIDNPRKIADMIEEVKPVPDGTYPPVIEGAEEEIREECEARAHDIYGDELPEIVKNRMERELGSIIGNGYAVLYLIAEKLVKHSEEDGYLVGSRGSVGSSFAAMLCGITEVNSLPPHYVCPKCKYSEFFQTTEIVGPDLPDKNCPHCGTQLKKDGYDIPFETFLGFEGDKEPDIDLNFSGDNQAQAHAYTEVLFGKGKVFRAGTISTLAEKTAFGYVKNFFEKKGQSVTRAEIERLKNGCTGVKRTTGQHPGGIMVVPRDRDITEFTPVQHPADDTGSDIITTHFDYHSISGRLLKLDILGHDDPTMLRLLYDLTGVDPRSIPLDDKKVLSLFAGTEALDFITECPLELGTCGIPEFGTPFVKEMVKETKPSAIADLIRISGLSHGTDVWTNNAQLLVKNGTATIKEVICTRDDIMLGLISMGLPPKTSFSIMEKVRKGKGLTEEAEALMRENKVPNWYIDSCKKIGYMFPKAHAAAYIIMAFRIAWYKVYYPLAYYAAFFGIRAKEFDLKVISAGLESIKAEMARLEQRARTEELGNKEKDSYTSLELALEMYCRGYSCACIDLKKSHYRHFVLEDKTLIPPFTKVPGLGDTVALHMYEEIKKGGILSQDELMKRTGLNKSCLEQLSEMGCLDALPKSNQISFF